MIEELKNIDWSKYGVEWEIVGPDESMGFNHIMNIYSKIKNPEEFMLGATQTLVN